MKKTLYHGSYEIVQKPRFGLGKETNDYGQGFYMTENIEIAREWAVNDGRDGFVSKYEIDVDDLSILNLNAEGFSILNWIAILVDNRKPRITKPVMLQAKEWLVSNHLVDLGFYDAVIGYRADDSYYTFVRDFLANSITLGQLSAAMSLGKPGEQFVLKSKFAFDILEFKGFEKSKASLYYPMRKARDENARTAYLNIQKKEYESGIYIRDLMKGER